MPSSDATGTVQAWVPRILSEYEVGRAVSAIEAVSRSDKPIAEVGSVETRRADLESDLQNCLALVRCVEDVQFWIRLSGTRLRYGFHREPWALDALDFLDRAELADSDRTWISGLLFGYRPKAIQDFIARKASPRPRRQASG